VERLRLGLKHGEEPIVIKLILNLDLSQPGNRHKQMVGITRMSYQIDIIGRIAIGNMNGVQGPAIITKRIEAGAGNVNRV
jgi:hypothetical protein